MTDELRPPWLDAPPVDPYPYEETHDLRVGPDLHPALLGLLPFVGVWRGRGGGDYPTINAFEFAQEVRLSHDGRPFLAYESRAWLIEPDGTPIRPAFREVGYWRPVLVASESVKRAKRVSDAVGDTAGEQTDAVEALLMGQTGIVESYVGRIDGLRVELITDQVLRSATAKEVSEAHRLYGIVDTALLYAYEMAAVGQPLQAHLSAKLARVAG
ncbi:MAG TPA: FABP family protein [Micromonosporaceae bacterium]|jgi:hypothetical protein|nr:FABP family protein [Micromonosporaceae bacterium]